eukprot:gene22839-29013_t
MLTIYIEEASDGKGVLNSSKPIGDFHRSLADRVSAANRFVDEKDFKCEVVCDTMKNEVQERYNSHPERICIIQHGRIVHAGGAGPFVLYDIEGVIEWLKERDHREKSGEEQQGVDASGS